MAISPGLGAAISGASGLVSGLINKIGQKKTEKRQVAYQKELADYQYSKDLDMWERSNEYNKPGAQMARLKEAGLNPHLVYGNGSAVGNTAPASTPKYQNPGTQFKNVPFVDPNAVLGNYLTLKQTQQNIATAKANENLINAKAGTEVFNSMLKDNAAKKLGLEVGYMPELYKYNFSIKQGIQDLQQKQIDKLIEENKGVKLKNIHQGEENKGVKLRNIYQGEINKRAKQGIFQGDNNLKTLYQILMGGETLQEKYRNWKSNQGQFGEDFLPDW